MPAAMGPEFTIEIAFKNVMIVMITLKFMLEIVKFTI